MNHGPTKEDRYFFESIGMLQPPAGRELQLKLYNETKKESRKKRKKGIRSTPTLGKKSKSKSKKPMVRSDGPIQVRIDTSRSKSKSGPKSKSKSGPKSKSRSGPRSKSKLGPKSKSRSGSRSGSRPRSRSRSNKNYLDILNTQAAQKNPKGLATLKEIKKQIVDLNKKGVTYDRWNKMSPFEKTNITSNSNVPHSFFEKFMVKNKLINKNNGSWKPIRNPSMKRFAEQIDKSGIELVSTFQRMG
jgi:hypothetical protein